jgi:capsular polysaccharide export protein
MINEGIQAFAGKRVLLLQGPVSTFFARLAKDLRNTGAEVFKVNFNAGDWVFYPRNAINYQGKMKDWPAYFEALIKDLNIDAILLFGDCRRIHQDAHAIADQHGLEIGVFEEGYVRPDYITLERFGVNAYSKLSREPVHYQEKTVVPKKQPVGNAYWAMIWFGFWYGSIAALGKIFFRHYQHHRPLSLLEFFPWMRSARRKQWYRWAERGTQEELITHWDRQFFLAPLQVFNDSQIIVHADFDGVEHFIEDTLHSFAQHAPKDTLLVFKHHPMDRGYRDYTKLINKLAREAKVAARVLYIHDQHLPTLLNHVRGVVVVNSTVGLSALHHGAPTITCGNAMYDIAGLTYQNGLDQFWQAAPNAKPNNALYLRFKDHLVAKTQLNGSFYKPLKLLGSYSGLIWNAPENTLPQQAKRITPASDIQPKPKALVFTKPEPLISKKSERSPISHGENACRYTSITSILTIVHSIMMLAM